MQGVFQINAVQPVRYVIEEVSGLFDVSNEVCVSFLFIPMYQRRSHGALVPCSRLLVWRFVYREGDQRTAL